MDGCESSSDMAELLGVVSIDVRRFTTGVDCAVGYDVGDVSSNDKLDCAGNKIKTRDNFRQRPV
jgi:hypothetical protein